MPRNQYFITKPAHLAKFGLGCLPTFLQPKMVLQNTPITRTNVTLLYFLCFPLGGSDQGVATWGSRGLQLCSSMSSEDWCRRCFVCGVSFVQEEASTLQLFFSCYKREILHWGVYTFALDSDSQQYELWKHSLTNGWQLCFSYPLS